MLKSVVSILEKAEGASSIEFVVFSIGLCVFDSRTSDKRVLQYRFGCHANTNNSSYSICNIFKMITYI